jgi:hypothetical protein
MRKIQIGDKYLCNTSDYEIGYFTKGNIYEVEIIDYKNKNVTLLTDSGFAYTLNINTFKSDFKDLQEVKEMKVNYEVVSPKNDAIVSSVMFQLAQRSITGQQKYGTTLQENNNDDFLQHLKEELMDAILYIEKLQTLKNK